MLYRYAQPARRAAAFTLYADAGHCADNAAGCYWLAAASFAYAKMSVRIFTSPDRLFDAYRAPAKGKPAAPAAYGDGRRQARCCYYIYC